MSFHREHDVYGGHLTWRRTFGRFIVRLGATPLSTVRQRSNARKGHIQLGTVHVYWVPGVTVVRLR
jgi:hypothetical protein